MNLKKALGYTVAFSAALLFASPALAEPHGDALGRALTALVLYGAGYLTVILLLIVLAIRRRKRAFLRVLAVFLAVVLVYPLLDSGLMLYQKARVAAAEIRKPAPDLREKALLFIAFNDRCYHSTCQALLELQGGEPLWTIPPGEAARLDFASPIDLSRVPLARWMPETAQDPIKLDEQTGGAERPVFDYVVISRGSYYLSRASSVIDALPQKPSGTLLGDYLSVNDLATPIENNRLDLASAEPELLTFYNARRARKAPLFMENTTYGSDHGRVWRESRADWFCGRGQNLTDAQYDCREALR